MTPIRTRTWRNAPVLVALGLAFGHSARADSKPSHPAQARAPSVVSAQRARSGGPGEGARQRSAREKFEAGVERIQDIDSASSFEQGCALFRESQRLLPSPDATRFIAVCLSQAGRWVEALEALEALEKRAPWVYLFRTDWASSPHELTEARVGELIEQLRAKIAVLRVVSHATRESFALTRLNAAGAERTPRVHVEIPANQAVRLNPGSYRLQGAGSGAGTATQTLKLNAGARLEIVWGAKRPGAQISPATGDPDPEARASLVIPATATAGVGVALVMAGLLIGNHSQSLESELKARCPLRLDCDASLRSDYREARGYALTANLALGTGALAVATGLGLYLIQLGRSEEPATLTAGCMLDGCAVSMQGEF